MQLAPKSREWTLADNQQENRDINLIITHTHTQNLNSANNHELKRGWWKWSTAQETPVLQPYDQILRRGSNPAMPGLLTNGNNEINKCCVRCLNLWICANLLGSNRKVVVHLNCVFKLWHIIVSDKLPLNYLSVFCVNLSLNLKSFFGINLKKQIYEVQCTSVGFFCFVLFPYIHDTLF